jgi:RNA-directed DNA polymerase
MAQSLLMPEHSVRHLCLSAPYRYKVYRIPKRRAGEYRVIAQPAREVKLLQRWVVKNLLEEIPIHPCAVAYIAGVGIRENAQRHVNNPYILKLDFKNFFNSIKYIDLSILFRQCFEPALPFEDEDALCKLLLWWSTAATMLQLSVGAPSSPLISNAVMFMFDEEISQFCRNEDVVYTRYADDLVFSSESKITLRRCEDLVRRTLANIEFPRLSLNEEKTVYASRANRRQVTGLVLTNNEAVSIGRDRKRLLRSMVHRFFNGQLNSKQVEQLRGHLAFAHATEPVFIDRLKRKYGAETVQTIFSLARRTRSPRPLKILPLKPLRAR